MKKFKDRKTAYARIWAAVAPKEATAGAQGANVAPVAARSRKKASRGHKRATARQGAKKAATGRQGSKTAKILALLERSHGASLKELMAVTGWQAHSVRGFISGGLRKKMGLKVESLKREDGERAYRVVGR